MFHPLGWARRRFPDHRWEGAAAMHGAFHDVVLGKDVVARLVSGAGHAPQARGERDVWSVWESVALPLPVPRLLSEVRSDGERSGYLIERMPGHPAADVPWAAVRSVFVDVLAALRNVEVPRSLLPPARAWCGGLAFPTIVRDELAPLLADSAGTAAAALAVETCDRALAIEDSAQHTLVHGDLGPHNLLWDSSGAPASGAIGLIDVDHATVADQVLDLAPLIGFYGAEAVRDIASAAEVERAVIYRSSLALQVAAAAQLRGAVGLRDHALGNFVRRANQPGA